MTEHGLGRIQSKAHPRMLEFPAEALLPEDAKPRSYTWDCDLWLDQGATSKCVGFSWTHEAAARPVLRTDVSSGTADKLYRYAQDHDYWPGTDYDGTSVDGGAQAARQYGFIESWYWARNLETALLAVALRGPAIIGVDWWTGMLEPDAQGFIHPTGAKEGGHAILWPQVRVSFKKGTPTHLRNSPGWSAYLNHDLSYIGLHNSWGEEWQPRRAGEAVNVRMRIPEFSQVLTDGGECCIPVGRLKA